MTLSIYDRVKVFLKQNCRTEEPLLLALSGGPDSLALFFSLLEYRKQEGISFHVAHVDHGWRDESGDEAQILAHLADQHDVPFHLKKLKIVREKKNLEAICREERYTFFDSLMKKYLFQALLTGHHFNDRAETILKRIFEGGHWSNWGGIQPVSTRNGFQIFRPLLKISKREIEDALAGEEISPFIDPTNRNTQFLRARLRETLIPQLNEQFGKDIQKCLVEIGNEADELAEYFGTRIAPYLENKITGPFGSYVNLEDVIPISLLELKYLFRQLCRSEGFFLSRQIIEWGAHALMKGKANQKFEMGHKQIFIDRKKVFILNEKVNYKGLSIPLLIGSHQLGHWSIDVRKGKYEDNLSHPWQEGWKGSLKCFLPEGEYTISLNSTIPSQLRKRWSKAKIPSFLPPLFPIIEDKEKKYYEFLTGKNRSEYMTGVPMLKILLTYRINGPNVKV